MSPSSKKILIGIVVIGLIISIIFNILNAENQPILTPAEISAGITSPPIDWNFVLNVAAIPIGIVSILVFLIYNFNNLFNNQLNAPIPSSDVCSIVPGTFNSISRIPSLYFAHISFFLSYLFMNAFDLYNINSDPLVDQNLVNNRKYRSFAVMVILVLTLLSLIVLRYFTSHCDSPLGIIVTISIFTFSGFAWYKFAEYCGARNSDLMGISQSILSSSSTAPVVCAQVSSNTS